MGNVTNEQQPADQGRGVEEGVSVPMILWAMRNWADVADRCAVTEGHAPSCIRTWADLLEVAISALTQPKGDSDGLPPAAVWNAEYNGWVVPKRFGLTVLCEQSAIVWNECRDAFLAALSLPLQSEAETWRCFHCGEAFTDREGAALHFGDYGPRSYTDAHCLIDAPKLRDMESQLQRYQEEDGPIHRLMHRQAGEHSVALRRAEEAGYAQALKDTNWKENTNPQPGQADTTPAPPGVGDGMVVVPREPTSAMIAKAFPWLANWQHMRKTDRENAIDCAYRAMIQAASAPGGRDV